ncbi:MAG TPA: hypothetical protein PK129_05625 [Cellvibrionaceae bacterium]|nr:hypothetical protein [Cellvibrionaceae bacterium]
MSHNVGTDVLNLHVEIRYADTMRRYSFYITILLSLLLPLHAAASVWLSAPICPAEAAMADTADHTATDTSEEVVSGELASDCCDDMDCPEMQTCHGCNLNVHLFSPAIPVFTFSSDSNIHPSLNTPVLELFDPASVWRPPTNS